jgi:hypothetical protein
LASSYRPVLLPAKPKLPEKPELQIKPINKYFFIMIKEEIKKEWEAHIFLTGFCS